MRIKDSARRRLEARPWRIFLIYAWSLVLFSSLSACQDGGPGSPVELVPAPTIESVASQMPVHSSLPTQTSTYPPLPTPEPPDSGWTQIRPGLERRRLAVLDEAKQRVEQLYILRIDPAGYNFRVLYHPQPQALEAWQAETGALIVANGGFFRQEGERDIPTGLTVVDGQAIGQSYGDFAGMLAVSAAGPDLRWLANSPYNPDEALISALQSFPLLVKPGGELGFPAEKEDNRPDRRTVLARDRAGRFILLVAGQGYFTLHRLSAFLVGSDLDLDIALNLDGGPSSGLLLSEPHEGITAYSLLPVVIAISSR